MHPLQGSLASIPARISFDCNDVVLAFLFLRNRVNHYHSSKSALNTLHATPLKTVISAGINLGFPLPNTVLCVVVGVYVWHQKTRCPQDLVLWIDGRRSTVRAKMFRLDPRPPKGTETRCRPLDIHFLRAGVRLLDLTCSRGPCSTK
jgi:hypothetical protein